MIREATIAQRGHTAAEDAIYRRLWARGADTGDGARIARVGASELADDAAMCRKTALRAARGLAAKLSIVLIEPHDPVTRRPRLYRVRPWNEILAARTDAGLHWAHRRPGGAVVLLTDAQADEHPRQEWNRQAWAARHAPAPAPAAPAAPPRADPAPQIHVEEILPQVWAEIEHVPGAEAATAAQILEACASTGLPFDLARLLHTVRKHVGIIARGRIHTPMAYLLKLVPQSYSGPGYKLEAATARREETARQAAETQRQAETAARDRAETRLAAIAPAIRDAARSTWTAILEALEKKVIRQSFETWLKPTRGSHIEGRTLFVRVPSSEFQHIGDKYGDLMQEAIDARHFQVDDLRFVTDTDLGESA
jgi:hypothetical protein